MIAKTMITLPKGSQARKLTAWVTLAVGVPRVLPDSMLTVSPLRFFEPHVYGFIMIALGVMLFMTMGERRYSLFGRIIAAISMAMWIVLAAATTSQTSVLVNAIFAVVMFVEIFTVQGGKGNAGC
jgi:hypothetical protein